MSSEFFMGFNNKGNSENTTPNPVGMEAMYGLGIDNKPTKDIKIDNIDVYEENPYRVEDDDEMDELAESIRLNGITQPAIVFDKGNGRYQLVSGHRRMHACKKLGLDTLRSIVVDPMSDDELKVNVVECNRYRKKIAPSDSAKAIAMEYNALKRMGKLHPAEELAKGHEVSRATIFREVAIAALPDHTLSLLDSGKISRRAAYTLSSMGSNALTYLDAVLQENNCSISDKAAEKLAKYKPDSAEEIKHILEKPVKFVKKESSTPVLPDITLTPQSSISEEYIRWIKTFPSILPSYLTTDHERIDFVNKAIEHALDNINIAVDDSTEIGDLDDDELFKLASEDTLDYSAADKLFTPPSGELPPSKN